MKHLNTEPSPLPLGPDARLRILFLNTLSLRSSLNLRAHASQPYSTTGNIIGQIISSSRFTLSSILTCLDYSNILVYQIDLGYDTSILFLWSHRNFQNVLIAGIGIPLYCTPTFLQVFVDC